MRAVEILNASAGQFRHVFTAIDGRYSAASRLSPLVSYRILGKPGSGRTPSRAAAPLRLARSLANLAIETYRLNNLIGNLTPDLVLSYGVGAIGAALSSRITGAPPTICYEDGFDAQETAHRKSRLLLLRRLAYANAYRVVVPSRALEQVAVREFHVSPERLRRIPNGVDTSRFRPVDPHLCRAVNGLPQTGIIIGTVCHLRKVKRLDILITAFHALGLADARLLIVGDGPCKPEWVSLAKDLGLDSRIIWAGSQEQPEPWLNAMDVFISSSASEQMPLAVLEAMSCAKPVITTDVGDCRLILGEVNRDWIVPAGDASALSAAILRLVNAGSAAQIGQANRARCIDQFSHALMVKTHCDLYRQAIESRENLAKGMNLERARCR